MEETASKELVIFSRDLWMWYLERNVYLTAVNLPGELDRKLNAVIFQEGPLYFS